MLDGAIAGSVFTSPPVDDVLSAIMTLAGKKKFTIETCIVDFLLYRVILIHTLRYQVTLLLAEVMILKESSPQFRKFTSSTVHANNEIPTYVPDYYFFNNKSYLFIGT